MNWWNVLVSGRYRRRARSCTRSTTRAMAGGTTIGLQLVLPAVPGLRRRDQPGRRRRAAHRCRERRQGGAPSVCFYAAEPETGAPVAGGTRSRCGDCDDGGRHAVDALGGSRRRHRARPGEQASQLLDALPLSQRWLTRCLLAERRMRGQCRCCRWRRTSRAGQDRVHRLRRQHRSSRPADRRRAAVNVEAVRVSSLNDDFALLRAPGGDEVPDEVGHAIANALREAISAPPQPRPGAPSRRSSRAQRTTPALSRSSADEVSFGVK